MSGDGTRLMGRMGWSCSLNFRRGSEAVIDSGQVLGYDTRVARVLRRRRVARPYGARLPGNMDMPFVDTGKLEVFEKGIGGWRGRQFHSPSMTFCHWEFDNGAAVHEHSHAKKRFGRYWRASSRSR